MEKLTYRQAFDRITGAYLNNQLEPYVNCACFIGNLLGGTNVWATGRYAWRRLQEPGGRTILSPTYCERYAALITSLEGYTQDQIFNMELLFMSTIAKHAGGGNPQDYQYELIYQDGATAMQYRDRHPNYENALYEAMVVTLEMLKQIHIDRGEEVDTIPFLRRELQPA